MVVVELKLAGSSLARLAANAAIRWRARIGAHASRTHRACAARSDWPSRWRCHMTKLRGMTGRRIGDFATWRRSEGEVVGAVPSENVFFLVARNDSDVTW